MFSGMGLMYVRAEQFGTNRQLSIIYGLHRRAEHNIGRDKFADKTISDMMHIIWSGSTWKLIKKVIISENEFQIPYNEIYGY